MHRNKTPRKIVILGSAHPLRGGLAAYNERLAREYLSNGDDITIFNFSLQYPGFLFPGKTQYSTEPAPGDLDIRTIVNSVNPVNWYITGRLIKKMAPDLLIIKYWIPFMAPCLGTIARMSRKNRKTKVISILDNVIPHEHRPGDHFLSSYFIRSIDGFVAMSELVLNDLRLFDTDKPGQLCPHPLYDHYGKLTDRKSAQIALNLDTECRYILFFGFIRDYKGLDLLLEAFAKVDTPYFKLKLVVAGEFYTKPEPYFDLITELNLKDRVIMSNDFIADSRVADFFNAADLVVQPYKNATQSGVTQIAYHFEKPMITTNVGGLAEIVPDNKAGFVVNPDPDEIAHAIGRFYKENKEKEFTDFIRIEKSKYSWQRMIDTIDTLTTSK